MICRGPRFLLIHVRPSLPFLSPRDLLLPLCCGMRNSISNNIQYTDPESPAKSSLNVTLHDAHSAFCSGKRSRQYAAPAYSSIEKREGSREKKERKEAPRETHTMRRITGAYNTSKYFLLIKPEYWVSCPESLITFRLFCWLSRKKTKSRYAWFDFAQYPRVTRTYVAMNIHYFRTDTRHPCRDDDYGAFFLDYDTRAGWKCETTQSAGIRYCFLFPPFSLVSFNFS